jgi:hypothetical protein
MERAFTLRLGDDEVKALNELKKIGDEKTDNKIIRYVVLRFKNLMDELGIERKKNRELTDELKELKGKVKAYNDALKQLGKIK